MQNKERPLGVLLLGGINLFILGIGSLLVFIFMYQNSDSESFKLALEEMNKYLPEANLEAGLLKKAMLIQMLVSLIFALSGWGLLARRELARKFTVYFAFFTAALTVIVSLFNSAIVRQAFLQIVYPGILIVYLTNKNVENYFSFSGKNNPGAVDN